MPANLCLVGKMGVDDNGLLALNGHRHHGQLQRGITAATKPHPLNIPISSNLVTGTNTLALGWGSTDNSLEAFRLQAVD